MKRMIISFIAMVVFLFSLHAGAEEFVAAYEEATGAKISYAEIDGKLIILGDYDALTGSTPNPKNSNSENFFQEHPDVLKNYTDLIMIMYKDGMPYLGVSTPITDGKIIDNTSTPLMSPLFLQNNIKIGN